MKTGACSMRNLVVLGVVLALAGQACTETPNAGFSTAETVDGILEILDAAPAQVVLPAATDPTLTIVDPTDGKYFNIGTPVTPVTVTFTVTNWAPYPSAGKSVTCYIDGDYDGTSTGTTYMFADVPAGQHVLTCELFDAGIGLKFCEASDSVTVKVAKPCAGPGDPTCDDGNPCSLEACTSIGGGLYECHFGPSTDPDCCMSKYDCACSTGGKWEYCDAATSQCTPCLVDGDCEDGNPCTTDACDKAAGTCKNDWIVTAQGKCCSVALTNPDAPCDDGKFCTIDSCNLGGGYCVNTANPDPICCETEPDTKCDDNDVCTLDKCIAHECRHGPVADPNCCNNTSECNDGNPCTDDACVGNTCVYTSNNSPNCCTLHVECGFGGKWDDGDVCTIDYCKDYQCQHVFDPECCDDTGLYPCLPDTSNCTTDACINNKCEHTIIKGCCLKSGDCNDSNVCTTDSCLNNQCVNAPVAKCCNLDIECKDTNPCNLDKCVNHVCRYGPNPALPDCCKADADCSDGITCTSEYCDTGAQTCIKSLVPNMSPKCCWTDVECADSDPFTLDKCLKNQCSNKADTTICDATHPCNDNNPCTSDVCDANKKCQYTAINGCCTADAGCTVAPLTDGNICTTDKCVNNKCVFTPVTECCTKTADCAAGGQWDDKNSCTTDSCVSYSCKHVKTDPTCCIVALDCNDNLNCTIDSCDANKCTHTVDALNDECCTISAECDDGLSYTLDSCVNYACVHTDIANVCTVATQATDCDDLNACTCDRCVFGKCRNLTSDIAPADCGLPETCCQNVDDCQASNDPCILVSCDGGKCVYEKQVPCAVELPYTQKFNTCAALSEINWSIVDKQAASTNNWKCVATGPLGPDNHMRFNWSPQIAKLFDSYLVTPSLDADPAKVSAVTVQFDRYLDLYENSVDLGLFVIQDKTGTPTGPDKTDTFVPVWAETSTTDLDAEMPVYQIPSQYLSGFLYLGFKVSATNSYNLNAYDLDNVKVCPGYAPSYKSVPTQINSLWNSSAFEYITVTEPDATDKISLSVVSGPSFVTIGPVAYSSLYKHWYAKVIVDPTSDADIGDYTVVVRATDGCIERDTEIPIHVLVSGGYIVWQPDGVPDSHGEALRDAIKANGKTVQLVNKLDVFANFDGIKGIFVATGVYGSKVVLTNSDVTKLTAYLDAGGKVYLEGGDTWAFDSWTNLHPYFKIEAVDDGDQLYAGPVEGRHFCYKQDFDVSPDYMVNNFLDMIDAKLLSGAVPVVWDGSGQDYGFAVAYEDGTAKYRTIGASIPFAAYVPKAGGGTVNALMGKWLYFFENGFPPCTVDAECNDSVQCTSDKCEASKCTNTNQEDCIPCIDDQDCPEHSACVLASNICAAIPGSSYPSIDTPISIGSLTPKDYVSTINVDGTELAQEVNVKLYLQHAYRGDLEVKLEHAGKTVKLVCANPADSTANYYITYDLGSPICQGALDLTAFENQGMAGDWTLTVSDKAFTNGGKLLRWTLYIKHSVPACLTDPQCNDGNPCTTEKCVNKLCEFKENTCDDQNACTADSCNAQTGCAHAMKDCDDGNPCTTDSCNPVTADCINSKMPNCNAACTTHNDCGLNDYCDPNTKTCKPIPGDVYAPSDAFPTSIPDNVPTDVVSQVVVTASGKIIEANVKVLITHPFSGDLTVTLTNGTKTLKLHKQSGGAADNVYRVYDLVEKPDDGLDMSAYHGMLAAGTWTLTVHDWVTGDSGTLDGWRLFLVRAVCVNANDCDDNNACTIDACNGAQCAYTPIECDDGSWCNGEEVCDPVAGCIAGVPVKIDDGVSCTADLCSEAGQTVTHTPQDLLCDNSAWCDGEESCDAVLGCIAGTPQPVSDGIACTQDSCDEKGDTIQHAPMNGVCDDGLYCNGTEKCDVAKGCTAGSIVNLSDGIDCTTDSCDEPTDTIVHTVNHTACDNGKWCDGFELCDSEKGCIAGSAPFGGDDGIACTVDTCDEGTKKFAHLPDDLFCNDGLYCNGVETCVADVGCVAGLQPVLTDGVSCTADTCNEALDTVVHTPDSSKCTYVGNKHKDCVKKTCDAVLDCQYSDLVGTACDEGELCLVNSVCQPDGSCAGGQPNLADPLCNNCCEVGCQFDGNYCNGVLQCNTDPGKCYCELKPGTVVTCTPHPDQCMVNECDPATGKCVTKAKAAGSPCNDGQVCTVADQCNGAGVCIGTENKCSDGLFCNGQEQCNPATGACSPGTPPVLTDNVGCTADICDEPTKAVKHVPNHAYCADATYCNGQEQCDPTLGCIAGKLPLDDSIGCTTDTCDEVLKAIIHTPNNAMCDDKTYCNGPEICSKTLGCQSVGLETSDGIACTKDSCDEVNDVLLHTPDHDFCSDSNACNGTEYCDVGAGCKNGVAPDVSDGIDCTLDSCSNGVMIHLPSDDLCNDGKWCNGTESCNAKAGCTSQNAPALDDGIVCTVDYCDETLDKVVHQANDTLCDDGKYCNGAEFCSSELGCTAGSVPACSDGDPCTVDSCNAGLNGGVGACDNTQKVQYCTSKCGGTHIYDAGDNDCGYDDACVGGLAGEGLGTCTPICNGAACSKGESGAINAPINDVACITKTVNVQALYPYIADLDVKVEVLHSRIGDLKLTLKAPDGTAVALWAKGTGGTKANFYNTFTASYPNIPGSICSLQGKQASGNWTLEICDEAAGQVGTLSQWKVFVESSPNDLSKGNTCEAPITLVSTDGTKDLSGTTVCATNGYSDTCGGGSAADRVYKFTLDVAKKVSFDLSSGFDAIIYLRGASGGTCAGSPGLICKDTCAGFACNESLSARLTTPGVYYFFVDGTAGKTGSYSFKATFKTLVPNGQACAASDECISNYCNNGYCCDANVCCNVAGSCPAQFKTVPTCDTPGTCQGHRVDAVCGANFQCSSNTVEDDSGCQGETANLCGCYPSLICTNAVSQPIPSCPTSCSDNSDLWCDTECHCDLVCEPDYPDGQPCDEDSDCVSEHCQNGFCCSGGSCCVTADDCPEDFFSPPVCDNPGTCQGHKSEKICANSSCGKLDIEDDTACYLGLEADPCGYYKSIYCSGGLNQTAPECPTSCLLDSECDEDGHCDGTCVGDLPNGDACDENSDCISAHCENGYCCTKGVCCNNDVACPPVYSGDAVCDNSKTCQGHKKSAACLNFECASSNANNDSACGVGLLADECGLFKSIYCNGEVDQPVAACPTKCTGDADCDDIAHCDATCELDYPNGTACDENSDCISDHCQNGFCCDSGDCCIVASNCPAKYKLDPTCDDPSTCQGHRLDKRCDNYICNNEPILDDSGCTAQTVSDDCSCYAPVMCNGQKEQGDPTCPAACASDAECDTTCHCDGTCEPDLPNGAGCDESADCLSGFCVDGVCCDTACDKNCQACNKDGFIGTCTPHAADTDPENNCGLCSVCNGASACAIVTAGLDPLNECPLQAEATCLNDGSCDGKGACRQWVAGTLCVPQSCLGTTKYVADHCDGAGMCVDEGTVSCVPYQCDALGKNCMTSCDEDADCAGGYWCNASGKCVAKKSNGQECGPQLQFGGTGNGTNQCISGFCADGYCCNLDCTSDCRACNVAGIEGTCTFHAPLSDPEDDCTSCRVCNGAGTCVVAVAGEDPVGDCDETPQNGCGLDGNCDGAGACRYWLPGTTCADQSCVVKNGGMEDFQYNADTCDGSGLCVENNTKMCYPYICNGDWGCYTNCFTDAECAPDTWCKGTECVLKKDNGETCSGPTAGNECKSGFCVDGVCCENSCVGACRACNIEGSLGTCTGHAKDTDPEEECGLCLVCDGNKACGFASVGTDPTSDCASDLQSTCQKDGLCTGAGACRLWIDGTVCVPQSCQGSTLHKADTCNGAGTCVDKGTLPCAPYVCNATQTDCLTLCQSDADCFTGYWCNAEKTCVSKKELGDPCVGANECKSNFCVDGYCCNNACNGGCATCGPATPPDPLKPAGICRPHDLGTDPENDCPTCKACSGIDVCSNVPNGVDNLNDCALEGEFTCGKDGFCDGGGACRLWANGTTCVAQYCADHVKHLDDKCNGSGVCSDGGNVDCTPYQCAVDGLECRTSCSEDPHCVTTHWCDTFVLKTNTCKPKLDNGAACVQGNQCKSSFCIDGVCCETDCSGACRNCAIEGKEGLCSWFNNDTDPENDCTLCQVCNGAGACKKAELGTDPLSECTQDATSTCGKDGTCDGNGACAFWNTQTVCVQQSCVGILKFPNDYCDGKGLCSDSGEVDCVPYVCNDVGTDCRSNCFQDAHCQSAYYCNTSNLCAEKKVNGEVCAAGNECKSGFCVDGYCCDDACNTTCLTCSKTWKAPVTITVDGNMADWDNPGHRLGTGTGGVVQYFLTWDNDYVYVAWKGVNQATDKLAIAFDEDVAPLQTHGADDLFAGVTFSGTRRPEYAIVFNGAGDIWYVPANAQGNWDAAQNVSTWFHYAGHAGNLISELRIPRAYLGLLNTDNGFAVWMWAANKAESNVWSIWPKTNPTGNAPIAAPYAQFARKGPGMCQNHTSYSDPEFECGTCKLCNGQGGCLNANNGEDPKDECVQEDQTSCKKDGMCDGGGACRFWNASTVCVAQTCINYTLFPADFCSGSGTCVDSPSVDCKPYICDVDAVNCRTGCENDSHCQSVYYCSGNACLPKKANGEACGATNECLSGYCVDGVCCDTACDKICEACNKAGKLGLCTFHEQNTDPEDNCTFCSACTGSGNKCSAVAAGTDPVNDCEEQTKAQCQQDGTCETTGKCRLWQSGTVCLAQYCSNYVVYWQDTCDGVGVCSDGGSAFCAPYACDDAGFACRTFCQVDAHCVPSHFCNNSNVCQVKQDNGAPCGGANQCKSGYCVDGVCCNTQCADKCASCKIAGSWGTCSYSANNTDPDLDCALCSVCNGTGDCKAAAMGTDPKQECLLSQPFSCGLDGECDGNAKCRFWNPTTECTAQTCAGHIKSPKDYCDGGGKCKDSGTVDCEPYLCNPEATECLFSCQDDTDCMPVYWCEGQVCVPKKQNGESCGGGNECLSSFCVDGYCCNSSCGATCESCAIDGFVGTCALYAQGTDPQSECGTCKQCSGANSCESVPDGEDPFSHCQPDDVSTCDLDGVCNGAGACRKWAEGSVCVEQYCAVSTQFEADLCDGKGGCIDYGSVDCSPYMCDADGINCRTHCTLDEHCVPVHWCNGNVCEPKKDNGDTCSAANQCKSNNCADGYCCNTPCNLTCNSCAVLPGTCVPHPPGTDPDDDCPTCYTCNGGDECSLADEGTDPVNDCVEEPVSTCQLDGTCDGNGACRFWVEFSVCMEQYCENGFQHNADLCDGLGVCSDEGTVKCSPYVCDGDGYACLDMCVTSADCVGTHWCDVPVCVPKKEIGDLCVEDDECKSNHCADGYCCNTACDGLCEACNIVDQEGTCAFFGNLTDPEDDCGTCKLCNGGGACANVLEGLDAKGDCPAFAKSTCQLNGWCDGNGACQMWENDTICVAQSCVGTQLNKPDYCNGTGTCIDFGTQSCCPYKCWGTGCRSSCSSDFHCCTGYYCNGSACVAKKADGQACISATECQSNYCVDGYCCNEACTGSCRSCGIAGKEGSCSVHAANTDPEFECGLCKVCNGAGACKKTESGQDYKSECSQSVQQSCGYDGTCNGNAACKYWDVTTVCKQQACQGTDLVLPSYCSGAGQCVTGATESCCPYACNAQGTGCRTGCTVDFDCCGDHYCFNGACVPRKADGETCSSASECDSGYCVDGFCCNSPCQSLCESCGIAGQEGTCSKYSANTDPENNCPPCTLCDGVGNSCIPAVAGLDPADDCSQMSQSSCGYDGVCDGAGSCSFWDAGIECFPQYCVGGYVFNPDQCSGTGVCADGGFSGCNGYICDDAGFACRTSCTQQYHCSYGFYCDANSKCVPKKGNGQPCGDNNECSSWYCVDGYCCSSPCAGQCQACNVAGSLGTCVNIANDTDPANECGPCKVCSGGGMCKSATKNTDPKSNCTAMPEWGCGYDGLCNGNGACQYWASGTQCVSQSCVGSTLYMTDYCNGLGLCLDSGTASCSPYKCGTNNNCLNSCTTDADCVTGFYCSGQLCVAKKSNGAPCSTANECNSGYCVDGYCCNSTCTGSCRACNKAGSEGVCTFHQPSSDPEAECGVCKVCDGAGACGNAAEGADPKNDCIQLAPSSCDEDGVCNGKGACRQWAAGTIATDESCAGSTFTATTFCDGSGKTVYEGVAKKTCEDLEANFNWKDTLGSAWVCTSAEPCGGEVGWAQALSACQSRGGRLCTYSELTARDAQGGGCTIESKRIWTLSECGEGKFWTGPGNPDNLGAIPKECRDGTTQTAYVACCGDEGDCCPYKCSGTGCGTFCGGDSDCCDGYYCEGGQCKKQKDLGQTCVSADQCPSGFCVDGYCCDKACTGGCEACNINPGICTAQPVNTDPENFCGTCKVCDGTGGCKFSAPGTDPGNDCAQQAQSSCGFDGNCDGSGTCRVWPAATKCSNLTCVDSTLFKADECDGVFPGSCVDKGTTACCPYLCDAVGSGCRTTCTNDGQCCTTAWCDTGQSKCSSKKANGTTCAGGNECLSGYCVDGVCCNTSCSGSCQACNVAGVNGICTNYGNDTDPGSECGLCKVCNGAGACKNVTNGTDPKNDCTQQPSVSCGYDGMCNGSGACRQWDNTTECVAQSCGGSTFYPADKCNGSGQCSDAGQTSCCPYKCSADQCKASCLTANDCCDGYTCQGALCKPKKADGTACSNNAECTSGKCVDGYCCDSWCAGTCQACNLTGKLGICTNYTATTDPEDECGTCKVCNGSGACANVVAGLDPLGDCDQSDPTTCNFNGVCDGGGGCQYWPASQICSAQACVGFTKTATKYCNGTGSCLSGGSTNCCPYTCTGNDCRTTCSDNSHCCSGYFCISGSCLATKPNGSTCTSNSECTSGFCVDGYCCDTGCTGTCQSCNQTGKLGTCTNFGANTDPDNECGLCKVCNGSGSCVNVPNGSDPVNDCTQEAPCAQDGNCDGNAKCRLWNNTTSCNAQTCSGSTLYKTDYCDGVGVCIDSGTTNCAPYKCAGNACATNCATDTDCVVGYYCSASVCVAKKALGENCGGNGQCLSGFCVDGVCCDGACTGTCRACNLTGTVGLCTFIGNNTDSGNECGSCKACDGAGACKNVPAGQDPKNNCTQSAQNSCGDDGACDGNGLCRKWPATTECGSATCVGDTLSPTDYCSGTGSCTNTPNASCCPFLCSTGGACKTSCTSNADCCTTAYCNGSSCVSKKTNGQACANAGECSSGFCVDGYCCDNACTGTCKGCNVAGSVGTCSNRLVNTDPENECGLCQGCNGSGACAAVTAGTDPFGDCNQTDPTTCGQSGNCNGASGCEMWPNSTVCVVQTCSDATLSAADYCNGNGVCSDSGSSSCCPYKCTGNSCRTTCSDNTHCCTGYWCTGGQCKTKKANGETCTNGAECVSGYCVDGVCCDKACNTACMACNLTGFVGQCTFHSYLTDPDNDCPACVVCNGSGACTNAAAGTDPFNDCAQESLASCGNDGVCSGSGACRKWPASTICNAQSCSDHNLTATDYCNGSGTCVDSGSTDCCPYDCLGDSCSTSCTSDNGCCDSALCKNGGLCQNCSTANPCPSGQWCCKGDSCDPYINLKSPPNSNDVDQADGTYYSSTYGSSNQFDYSCCSNANGSYATDRVFHFDTKNDSVGVEVTVKVWGNFDTVLYMRSGTCGQTGSNFQYNDNCSSPLPNGGSCFTAKLTPGQDWWIYVDGMGTARGDFTLQVDFKSLCMNCTCDTSYGENQSNNPVECYHTGDYCGNYINVNVTSRPQKFTFDDNLEGDHNDFSHQWGTGSYNYNSCSDCSWCHGQADKIYRLHLPWDSNYVIFRMYRTGGWSPDNYPRLFMWKSANYGTTECDFGTSQPSRVFCLGPGAVNEVQVGWVDSGYVLNAGTYWLMPDMWYGGETTYGQSPYRLEITIGTQTSYQL